MKIHELKVRILNNTVFRWLYCQEQDFNIGRGFFGKFTSLSQEFTLAILISTQIFGIDLSKNIPAAIKWTIMAILIVYLFGKIYRRLNFLEIDQRAVASRNPVNKIQLEAAEIIIARFGSHKDELIKK
jgi:hypothetical protein